MNEPSSVRFPGLQKTESPLSSEGTPVLDGPGMSSPGDNALSSPSDGGPPSSRRPRASDDPRRRLRHIDIRVARGSLGSVGADACALGVFRDVSPSGAAKDIDRRLGGALSSAIFRGHYRAKLGAVFPLPTRKRLIASEHVLLVGLGHFDHFMGERDAAGAPRALASVGASLIEAAVQWSIAELATVIPGLGSGAPLFESVQAYLGGILQGLAETDRRGDFKQLILCDIDDNRCCEIVESLRQLQRDGFFGDLGIDPSLSVEVDRTRESWAPPPIGVADPVYLLVRQIEHEVQGLCFSVSVLTSGGRAAVVSGKKVVDEEELAEHLSKLERRSFSASTIADFGEKLAALVLPESVREVLSAGSEVLSAGTEQERDELQVVVVHDRESARIPWETLRVDGYCPAERGGLSRRYMSENLCVAKWLESRRARESLDVLLIVNPGGDLVHADEEGDAVHALLRGLRRVNVKRLSRAAATREAILHELESGEHDVVHYAGHAVFSERTSAESGIACADGLLSGADLLRAARLPGLVFFNACKTGRLGQPLEEEETAIERDNLVASNGFAEAFMRRGVTCFLGTYWPVRSSVAATFARVFYEKLLNGDAVGVALQHGRAAVRAESSPDWANYLHYGPHDFVIKTVT